MFRYLVAFGLVLGVAQPVLSQPASSGGQGAKQRAEPVSAAAQAPHDPLESASFLEDLQAFAKTPGGSDEVLRSAAESDDRLGMARFCAITTHERYGIASHRPKDGIEYCRRLAEAGVPVGMFLYGRAYQYGRGVDKDYEAAVRWYRAAADSGNPLAMNNLALMYDRGRGVDRDEAEAARWYRKAAELNDAKAQRSLGWMYESGRGGLPRNIYQAIEWWTKAADGGEVSARKDLERLGVKYPRGNRSDSVQAWAIGFLAQVALALGLAYLLFSEFRQAAATDVAPADGGVDGVGDPALPKSSSLKTKAQIEAAAAGAGVSSRAVRPLPPRIPDDIRAAANLEEGATALLFALLMSDERARTHQLALLLKEAGPRVAGQSDLYAQKLHSLDPRVHAPIVELVMSRLKDLDPAGRDRLYSWVTALAEAQPGTSVEALTLLILFRVLRNPQGTGERNRSHEVPDAHGRGAKRSRHRVAVCAPGQIRRSRIRFGHERSGADGAPPSSARYHRRRVGTGRARSVGPIGAASQAPARHDLF